MRSLFCVSLAVGALAIPLSAAAGVEGTISTEVLHVSAEPNYSLGTAPADIRYIGFKATVENIGGNVANAVLYTSKLSVANQSELATFHAVEGATCTNATTTDATTVPPTTIISVDCSFGQMRPGQKREFVVVFKSPVKNASAPATNKVTYKALTLFSEGTGGPKSKPQNSKAEDTAMATLKAATGASAASVVPGGANGFTLFTVPNDVFSTKVTLPLQANAVPASIVETPLAASQDCNNFLTCYQSTITIPGSFNPFLTIVLRQDSTNIKNGTQIGSVQIWYDYVDANGNAASHPVGACANATTPRGDGLPCIAKAVHYKNSSVTGWTADLDDDFEWTLINTLNGSYRLP